MTVHVFATYMPETYLVEADSKHEARGKLTEEWALTDTVEYLGTVEEVMADAEGDVVQPRP